MSSLNKVSLIGRLTADPEQRTMQSGGTVTNFTVATSDQWKHKESGERKERPQFHRVVVFNEALGDVAAEHLKKGAQVYVEGKLEYRDYETREGLKRTAAEIVLRPYDGEIKMLARPPARSRSATHNRPIPSDKRDRARQGG